MIYDAVVVGGGPSGATAARTLALAGRTVLLLDRAGRIKPCGGAVPPRLLQDFEVPDDMLVAKVKAARMIAPSANSVDMPVGEGFVGMVDRDAFDEWLRQRAARAGAERLTGTFVAVERDEQGGAVVTYRTGRDAEPQRVQARPVR
jgi:geranylgeranyl diphosphate/geranylgeranyl-bacteriochlorophyllide a reductase